MYCGHHQYIPLCRWEDCRRLGGYRILADGERVGVEAKHLRYYLLTCVYSFFLNEIGKSFNSRSVSCSLSLSLLQPWPVTRVLFFLSLGALCYVGTQRISQRSEEHL